MEIVMDEEINLIIIFCHFSRRLAYGKHDGLLCAAVRSSAQFHSLGCRMMGAENSWERPVHCFKDALPSSFSYQNAR
jgi:hypothetical protein